MRRVKLGDWPGMDPDAAREAAVAVLGAFQREAPTATVINPTTATLADVWKAYRLDVTPGKRDSAKDEQLHRLHLSRLDGQPLSAINPPAVRRWMDDVRRSSGPVAANRARTLLGAVWRWALEQGHTDLANPVPSVRRFTEQARQRYLSRSEMKRFLRAVYDSDSEFARDAALLLLLTAQRKSNVLSMEFAEVDADEKLWTIPRNKFKGKREHDVPLVDEAAAIIERRRGHGRPFVFPALWGKRGWDGNLHAHGWNEILLAANLEDFRPHDLRRTAATWALGAGASEEAIAAWLGHKRRTITGDIYALADLAMARAAAETAARAMLGVMEGGGTGA